jgi:ribose 5-phosphate isomerase A
LSRVEEAKLKAALEAVKEVRNGFIVGLGSGTTAAYAIKGLGKALRQGSLKEIRGVPTSHQAASLARESGLPLVTLDEYPKIDIAIDGADQVDDRLDLIKGGGGALLREKIVAAASERYVIVVDETKLSRTLGMGRALPIEVLPFASSFVLKKLSEKAKTASVREGLGKVGPVVTDNGNFIVDADFGPIVDARGLETWLKAIPGVLETGLFLGLADVVYIGTKNSVETLHRKDNGWNRTGVDS